MYAVESWPLFLKQSFYSVISFTIQLKSVVTVLVIVILINSNFISVARLSNEPV
jgi:hypothetical protein